MKKKELFKSIIFIALLLIINLTAGSCFYSFKLKEKNPIKKTEFQKSIADMIISIDTEDNIYVEKPVLNVRGSIQYPYSINEFIELVEKNSSKKKILLVIFSDSWNYKDNSFRLKTLNKFESLLKKHFSKIIFHQENRYSYPTILKE